MEGKKDVKKEVKPKEESRGEPKKNTPKEKPQATKDDVRGIVRLLGADLDGYRPIKSSILRVRGIGFSLAKAFIKNAGIDMNTITGKLTEDQIEKLTKEATQNSVPKHMINRRSDPFDGKDKHLTSSDLDIVNRQDMDFVKKLGSYKGIRHRRGLPVRGQRTRSSFRGKGKTVGVIKSKTKK